MVNIQRFLEWILGAKKQQRPTHVKHFTGGRCAIDAIEHSSTKVVKRVER